ncbi:MAG: Arc family DNA-binding protein [Comamonas sp.]
MNDLFRSQFRLPNELADKLRDAAQESGRSLNAEVVARLQSTFYDPRFPAGTFRNPSHDGVGLVGQDDSPGSTAPIADEIAQKVLDKLIPLIGNYTEEQINALMPSYAKPRKPK